MEKYEPLGVVGEGSYGVVLKCRHRESGRPVAIKKFIDSEDDQNVRKIALREIRVLRKLRHENLVNLLEVFRRRKHLYLVFEFIDHTLLDELENKSRGLEPEIARKYVYQILRGLGFCHDNNIIHRDVKPENVLVSKNGVVKLCDFGFARNLCGPGELLTDYVATRWYRAPELLVGDVAYGKEVDIWAVGCLFAEMMSGEPLYPGDSDIDQLFLIAQCLGRLARRHLSIMSRNSAFRGFQFPKSRHGSTASTDSLSTAHAKLAKLDSGSRHSSNSNNIKGKGGSGSGSKNTHRPTPAEKSVFAEMFPTWADEAVVFLTLCLDPEPSNRPSCNALLRLAYFTHDNFPSRFINELNQKLQLEGRHPIPAYSTRKKRSVLGNLQHGANVMSSSSLTHHNHNVSSLTKKNPVYQGRLNLSEEPSTNNPVNFNNLSSTKYSDTFATNTVNSTVQKASQLPNPSQIDPQQSQPYKFSNFTRDQTFLVQKDKSFVKKSDTQETRIPTLLSRKYSDDSLLKSGPSSNLILTNASQNNATSKSTPNIVAEGMSSSSSILPTTTSLITKRFSIPQNQSNQIQSQLSSFSQSQPRKFSYSFPPPGEQQQQNNASHIREFGDENANGGPSTGSKIFQPLPVTTLSFSHGSQLSGSGGYPPYSLSVIGANPSNSNAKSPNPPYLNVSGYNTSHSQQKRTPSPTHGGRIMGKNNNNAESNNSSYFPHTYYSTNGNGGRYPVSFYQGNAIANAATATTTNFNPVSVFGSSIVLKNHTDFGVGVGETSFLPRMTGKTFTSSGSSVKDDEPGPLTSNYSKSGGTNSLPHCRRDSLSNAKWSDQSQVKNVGLGLVSKGVSKLNGNGELLSGMAAGTLTTSSTINQRHFSTYGTQ